ncbi:MAG: hypothetical protein ABS35_19590 [Kaistia sp. SCN 65-12]|uniref:hypothetical protein n=1 Tax=Bosea sp. (in: a-proteobacteria) TaxID=1871050 RepID=UPI00086B4A97|nr:hypothetical protein [Bosea sp. (in: a-proteobacteria)]MBN9471674.1 hypothetical protein [Bosea sp. (in: a-proteobacteria)]ODT20472.1 MAG: hypothetical protein ABS35_19590 [Kaistia sp. SCN 65-12]
MLAADRNTPRLQGDVLEQGLAATVAVFAGAIVMRNAAGYLTKGATATGSVGVGRAEERKTGGANAGDEKLRVRPGIYRFKNSTSADAITVAEIGDVCFIVDDEQVAKTNGTNTRSPAGFVRDVDAQGVWVEFDEVKTRIFVEGIANPV